MAITEKAAAEETIEIIERAARIPGRGASGRLETHPTRGRLGSAPAVKADRYLAKGLGWLSIGLGLGELIAPAPIARLIGVPEQPLLMRLLGARELLSGLAIVTGRRPVTGLWSRVVGDALDLSLLGYAAAQPCASTRRIGVAAAVVAGVTALDALSAARMTRTVPGMGTIRVVEAIAINRDPAACYALWRDLENLSHFMDHVERVDVRDDRRSHWVVCGPAGTKVEWDAEIVRDVPDALLAWRSLEGSEVDTAGMVQFLPRPGSTGTLLRVSLVYRPPAGALGAAVARLLGDSPDRQVREDLRRFKQLIETGEVATTAGQPAGKRSVAFGAASSLLNEGQSS